MKVNVDWNEWNGLMWNGVFGDPNCGMNDDRISIDIWSSVNVERKEGYCEEQCAVWLKVRRWIRIDVCYDNNGKKSRKKDYCWIEDYWKE